MALKGGFGVATYFIDALMRKFEIQNVIKIRRSFHPFVLGAKKKSYIVRYELSEPMQLTFDDVKKCVIDLVVRNHWYAEGGETREKFVREFEGLKDMPELLANLSAYGKVQF